jgi:hypothetical protein
MATWPNSNATQGKFTNCCSGYKGSVGSPVHASTLQATDQEMDLVRTGIVELLTIVIIVFTII